MNKIETDNCPASSLKLLSCSPEIATARSAHSLRPSGKNVQLFELCNSVGTVVPRYRKCTGDILRGIHLFKVAIVRCEKLIPVTNFEPMQISTGSLQSDVGDISACHCVGWTSEIGRDVWRKGGPAPRIPASHRMALVSSPIPTCRFLIGPTLIYRGIYVDRFNVNTRPDNIFYILSACWTNNVGPAM